ncbi:MAG: hypothetical protein WBA76_04480 [Phormidesmis sp.]
MAIVLALLVAGWLVAFALGAQVGFENQPAAPIESNATEATAATYREPASVA